MADNFTPGDTLVGLGADTAVADTPQDTGDDIEALLREFELGTQGTDQPADQSTDQGRLERDRAFAANLDAHTQALQIDARQAELQTAEQQLQAEYDQRDAAVAFETIRGNLSAEMFDDAMIDSWITAQAVRDPAIQQAWQNRAVDPKAYQRTLNKLAGEFGDKFRRFQAESEVDHEAVAQAVRGQGAKAPAEPPPNLGRMSDAELRQHIRDNYGYDPA